MTEDAQGLSLRGLAERLEAQTRRLEALEGENAELRGKVAALEGGDAGEGGRELAARKPPKEPGRELAKRSTPRSEEAVSRRAMLTKAGAAAAVALAAGTLLSPRRAEAEDGNFDIVHADAVTAGNSKYAFAVSGQNNGEGTGVFGSSVGAKGVEGVTYKDGYEGVYGHHNGTYGYGVVGDGAGASGAGVLGRNPSGYGGQFDGGKAQLWINPKGTKGRPKSGQHQKGEIYLDSVGALFICSKGGTPGTWRHVTTTSA